MLILEHELPRTDGTGKALSSTEPTSLSRRLSYDERRAWADIVGFVPILLGFFALIAILIVALLR
jgi:hypothetical protein